MSKESNLHSSSQSENPNGMRDVWCWALSSYLKPSSDRIKKTRQSNLVQAIKMELVDIKLVPDLHDAYCQDSRWCLEIARQMFPTQWPTLGVHTITATAYGIRYVEIMTNKQLDPLKLPKWVNEWAIW